MHVEAGTPTKICEKGKRGLRLGMDRARNGVALGGWGGDLEGRHVQKKCVKSFARAILGEHSAEGQGLVVTSSEKTTRRKRWDATTADVSEKRATKMPKK